MESGNVSGTSASAEMLAANENRDKVTVTLMNSVDVAFGLGGEDAVAGEGTVLLVVGASAEFTEEAARGQINIIGNTASVAYQTGPVIVNQK